MHVVLAREHVRRVVAVRGNERRTVLPEAGISREARRKAGEGFA